MRRRAAPVEALERRIMMAADVVINEIMYQATSHNEGDEWIELLNRGSTAANLANWKLTKGVGYTFGAGTLNPGQYLVVAANVARFTAKYPGVANVVGGGWTGRLSNSQEEVQLEDGGGVVVDSVTYSDQGDWAQRRRGPLDNNHRGWVWVQPASGGGSSLELINPALSNNYGQNWAASTAVQGTPGAANSVLSNNIAPMILDVSQSTLIPKSTDAVRITAKLVDELGTAQSASLFWRVDAATPPAFTSIAMVDDGSNGDALANDGVWTATIPPQADKSVIEFYISASDATQTRTWPAPTDDAGTQGANALYQVDDTVYGGTQPLYRLIFTEAERAEIAFIGTHSPDSNSNAKMNATFIAADSTGSQIRYTVGVRNRGHGSRLGTPNNYHLDIPTDNPWKGRTAINFNARVVYSQVLGSAIWRMAGFAASDTVPIQVRVNGAMPAASSGQFALVEEPDSAFARNHFPLDSNGNSYGAFRQDPTLNPEAELRYLGADPNSYRILYPKQTNSDLDDWSDLIKLVDVLNNTPANLLVQEVSKVINLDEWLHYIALDNLMLNRETGLVRGIGDDFNLYRGEVDPRFILVPHDLDTIMGIGLGAAGVNQSIFAIIEGVPGEINGTLQDGVEGLKKLLLNPAVTPLYYKAYLDMMQRVFNPTVLNPLIDQTIGGFASPAQIAAVKNFVTNRAAAVLNQISRQLTINSTLPTVGGYLKTNVQAASLSGSADATLTRSVLVNGLPATYDARTATWHIDATVQNGTPTLQTIIPSGSNSVWTYLADGSNQGSNWQTLSFTDSTWSTGRAQLGFGDGDETTPIPASTSRVTVYFRKKFTIADKSQFSALTVNIVRDDGAVVYLNGTRAINSNMGTGAVTFTTQPLGNMSGTNETSFFPYTVDPALLNNGDNIIAVEIHNATASNSADMSFDLGLDGALKATGPVTVSGGVPLHPGVNRVTVQAFDGAGGTGNEVNHGFVDIWYEGTNNGAFAPNVPVDGLSLLVPDSYRPGTPFLVQVQANNAGQIQRDLWDGTVTLATDRPDLSLSTNQIVLRNGWGSVMVTPVGAGTAGGSFTLSASLGNRVVNKTISNLGGAGMSSVSGTLAGNLSWSGVVHVTGNVIVPAGSTLTIEPGTLVLVDGVTSGTAGAVIEIDGKLQSLGTAAQPVSITAFDVTKNWGGLRFVNAQASQFSYTFISRAGNTVGLGHTASGPAVRASGTTLTFDHSAITDNVGKAGDISNSDLSFVYSEISRSRMGPEIAGTAVLLDHSWIFDNRGPDDADGIYLHDQLPGQTITLQHGMIGAVDDDDVDTLASTVTIDDMILRDAKDKGASILNGVVTIKNSLIAGNSLASEDATFSSVSAKGGTNGDVVTVNIDHTTIVANDPSGQGKDVGIESRNKFGLSSGTINYNVTNSIIVASKPVNIEAPYTAATVNISYSNTFGTNWTGTGNLNINPLFVDPVNHDYHLKAGSPSINAGNPAVADNDSDGSRSDQGFFRNGLAGARAPSTIGAGTLSGVTILSPENGPYLITGDVVIPAGATLYILPGTSIFFQQDTGITINGRLVADGSQYEQIRFTRVPGTTATWDGLQLANTNLDNHLSWSVLEWGTAGTTNNGMLGISTSRVTIDHVYFDKTDRRRIRFNNASFVLKDSEFADIFPGATAPTTDNFSEDVWGSGILAGGEVRVENNVFGTTKGHNDILDIDTNGLFGPTFVIRNNLFKGGGDDALDMEGDAFIEGNTFFNFIKDQYNTGSGNSNILSAGLGHNYTMIRNVVVGSEHVAQVKENSFLNFINNTVVGGATSTAAIYFFRPAQPNSWGKGAYIDGNIFKDKPLILADYTNTTQITLNRSIVPAAYFVWGTGNTSEDPRFVDQANGNFALRAGSPAKGTGPNGLDMGALVPSWASISGEPAASVGKTSATLIVGGPAIVAYKYRVNGGAWSAETPVATPISLSGLSNGSYTVYVIGKNSAGEWQDMNSPTASRTWTVDTITPSVRINEILASNNGGASPDLIELYNHGDSAVDLSGMSISDNPALPRKFVFAGGTILNAGQYLVLYADSKTVAGQIHTGFSLKNDGEGVYLYNTLAAGGGQIDGVAFGAQLDNLSIGRAPDGSWALNQPTFGAANILQRTGDPGTLKINEWNTAGVAPFADDFVEIYNPDPLPIAVGGFYLSDKPIPQPDKSLIPALSFISGQGSGGGGYASFVADNHPEDGALHTNFQLAAEQGMIGLFDSSKTKIDWVLYLTQRLGQSQGRTPDGGNAFTFYTQPNPGLPNPGTTVSSLPLRITEINFNPPAGSGAAASSDFEFLELKNTGASTISLSGVQIAGAANFTFGNIDLGAGQYVVVVRNATAFAQRFGIGINVGGVFTDTLDDSGGQLRLLDSLGATILDFGYSDNWQPSADGAGNSLVIADSSIPAGDWGLASSWRASRAILGTPGIDEDPALVSPSIVINEILAHSTNNAGDWVELRNTTGAPVDLSGWYLSNDAADLLKHQLTAGTIVPANGYLVINQAELGFALNGDGGEIYLSSSSTAGVLAGYRQGVAFGASDLGVTMGRHIVSTGQVDFTALSAATPGAANAYPRVGPIVINEIQYHPNGSASEFIELHNAGNAAVDLSDWRFTDGVDFTFASGTIIQPGAFLLVVPIDAATFRGLYDIRSAVQVVGPYQGSLSNNGETIELSRPGVSEIGSPDVPYVVDERVAYGTAAPWPAAPDGTGPSLARRGQGLYANDPANWTVDAGANGSPGVGNTAAPPTVAGAFAFVQAKRIAFVFSKDVGASLNASDLVLQNLTTGQVVPAGSLTLSYDPQTFTATWTSDSVFADGNYSATLMGSGISDVGARALDGNGDGVGGDDFVLGFFQLAGDANRDRTVDFADLVVVAQNYGSVGGHVWASGDFNGDGNVDFADLVALAQRYGSTLAAAPAAPAPAPIFAAPVAAAAVPATRVAAASAVQSDVPPIADPMITALGPASSKVQAVQRSSSTGVRPTPAPRMPPFSKARIAKRKNELFG